MQPANDVQLGDAELQGFPRLFNHLLDGQLEAVGVAFLACERAELARQDAIVRVVDVTIDDVAGAIADLFLTRQIGDGADRIQILRFKQPERVGFRDAFPSGDLVVEVAQFAALNEEIHFVRSHRPVLRSDTAEGGCESADQSALSQARLQS
jgi:hypothetical protein